MPSRNNIEMGSCCAWIAVGSILERDKAPSAKVEPRVTIRKQILAQTSQEGRPTGDTVCCWSREQRPVKSERETGEH